MRVSLLAAVLAVAAPAAADDTDWRFHCDGTDPWLLAELDEAMRSGVGYGETWDETVCNQGNLVLGEGVRPVKPKRDPAAPVATPTPTPTPTTTTTPAAAAKPTLTPLQQRMQDQYFAIFIPVFTLFIVAVAALLAAIVVFFLRRRKQVVVAVGCPSCRTEIPFVVGEVPTLFCPACGNACRVDIDMTGGRAMAAAVPL
jgi:hypothetical protein